MTTARTRRTSWSACRLSASLRASVARGAISAALVRAVADKCWLSISWAGCFAVGAVIGSHINVNLKTPTGALGGVPTMHAED
jgi:hypothetical protein